MSTQQIAVIGAGILGVRITRELLGPRAFGESPNRSITIVTRRNDRLNLLRNQFGSSVSMLIDQSGDAQLPDEITTVIIARAAGEQYKIAQQQLSLGRDVITTTDDPVEVQRLLKLHASATSVGKTLVVGASFAPGLSCLLASHASTLLDRVDEIHIARHGAAGPACAAQRLRALRGTATDWRDGSWVKRPGFSGRELCWFPDPIGARDCYRAALADPLLLVPVFPKIERVTARLAATRRDRVLAPFPVWLPAPSEGGIGALRVELRGERAGEREWVVYGALDRPAVAAAATAAVVALWFGSAQLLTSSSVSPGATGLAGLGATSELLAELALRGVRAAVFEGSQGS
ncbi:MAG: hypothetical protein WD029_00270 [Microthrixaceae bacterium]